MDLMMPIILEENISDDKPTKQDYGKSQNNEKIRKLWDTNKNPENSEVNTGQDQKEIQKPVFSGGDVPNKPFITISCEEIDGIDCAANYTAKTRCHKCLRDGAACTCSESFVSSSYWYGWQEPKQMNISTSEPDYCPTSHSKYSENPSTPSCSGSCDSSKTYVIPACRSFNLVPLNNLPSPDCTAEKTDSTATYVISKVDCIHSSYIIRRPTNDPTSYRTVSQDYIEKCEPEELYNSPSTCCDEGSYYTPSPCHSQTNECPAAYEPAELDDSPPTCYAEGSHYSPSPCHSQTYESPTMCEPEELENSPSTCCAEGSHYTPSPCHSQTNEYPATCEPEELENSPSTCCAEGSHYTPSPCHSQTNEYPATCEAEELDDSPPTYCAEGSHYTPSPCHSQTNEYPATCEAEELGYSSPTCCAEGSHYAPSPCHSQTNEYPATCEAEELGYSSPTCCAEGSHYTPSPCHSQTNEFPAAYEPEELENSPSTYCAEGSHYTPSPCISLTNECPATCEPGELENSPSTCSAEGSHYTPSPCHSQTSESPTTSEPGELDNYPSTCCSEASHYTPSPCASQTTESLAPCEPEEFDNLPSTCSIAGSECSQESCITCHPPSTCRIPRPDYSKSKLSGISLRLMPKSSGSPPICGTKNLYVQPPYRKTKSDDAPPCRIAKPAPPTYDSKKPIRMGKPDLPKRRKTKPFPPAIDVSRSPNDLPPLRIIKRPGSPPMIGTRSSDIMPPRHVAKPDSQPPKDDSKSPVDKPPLRMAKPDDLPKHGVAKPVNPPPKDGSKDSVEKPPLRMAKPDGLPKHGVAKPVNPPPKDVSKDPVDKPPLRMAKPDGLPKHGVAKPVNPPPKDVSKDPVDKPPLRMAKPDGLPKHGVAKPVNPPPKDVSKDPVDKPPLRMAKPDGLPKHGVAKPVNPPPKDVSKDPVDKPPLRMAKPDGLPKHGVSKPVNPPPKDVSKDSVEKLPLRMAKPDDLPKHGVSKPVNPPPKDVSKDSVEKLPLRMVKPDGLPKHRIAKPAITPTKDGSRSPVYKPSRMIKAGGVPKRLIAKPAIPPLMEGSEIPADLSPSIIKRPSSPAMIGTKSPIINPPLEKTQSTDSPPYHIVKRPGSPKKLRFKIPVDQPPKRLTKPGGILKHAGQKPANSGLPVSRPVASVLCAERSDELPCRKVNSENLPIKCQINDESDESLSCCCACAFGPELDIVLSKVFTRRLILHVKRPIFPFTFTFKSDIDEFKCKFKFFDETQMPCKCRPSRSEANLKHFTDQLEQLENVYCLTQTARNYLNIIQRNEMLAQKCLAAAKKLQMCGTEEEMREVASEICRNYLHGAWKTVSPKEIVFRRISGGLSNFLYLVGLPDNPPKVTYQRQGSPEDDLDDRKPVRSNSFTLEEPKKVLLRIYGQVHGERAMDAIVSESVIFTLLSERKLGPKLHGVFSGGRIEEYLPARPLLTKELADPAISMKIAEKMAAIHSMAVPLSKDPHWLWKTCYKWLKTVKEERLSVKGKNAEEDRIIQFMKTVDFDKELEWLKKFVAAVDSPVVFCHNDMQEGNILIFDDALAMGQTESDYEGDDASTKEMSCFEDANTSDSILSRISDSGEPRMVFIDFEYCAYNYRGFDIANHFQEWGYDYSNPEHPFYFENLDDLPTLEQKEIFIKQYLKHYYMNTSDSKVCQDPTVDEINQLLSEVEAFELSVHLLWTLWSLVNASKSQIPFGYWEFAMARIEVYLRLKQEIIKKGNGLAQKRKICEVDI